MSRLPNLSDVYSPDCDIPLLRKHLAWVEHEAPKPKWVSEWNQENWILSVDKDLRDELITKEHIDPQDVCGSYRCFAGNVVHEAGMWDKKTKEYKLPINRTISEAARDLLRINDNAASELFHANNTAGDIRAICEAIAGERL